MLTNMLDTVKRRYLCLWPRSHFSEGLGLTWSSELVCETLYERNYQRDLGPAFAVT